MRESFFLRQNNKWPSNNLQNPRKSKKKNEFVLFFVQIKFCIESRLDNPLGLDTLRTSYSIFTKQSLQNTTPNGEHRANFLVLFSLLHSIIVVISARTTDLSFRPTLNETPKTNRNDWCYGCICRRFVWFAINIGLFLRILFILNRFCRHFR